MERLEAPVIIESDKELKEKQTLDALKAWLEKIRSLESYAGDTDQYKANYVKSVAGLFVWNWSLAKVYEVDAYWNVLFWEKNANEFLNELRQSWDKYEIVNNKTEFERTSAGVDMYWKIEVPLIKTLYVKKLHNFVLEHTIQQENVVLPNLEEEFKKTTNPNYTDQTVEKEQTPFTKMQKQIKELKPMTKEEKDKLERTRMLTAKQKAKEEKIFQNKIDEFYDAKLDSFHNKKIHNAKVIDNDIGTPGISIGNHIEETTNQTVEKEAPPLEKLNNFFIQTWLDKERLIRYPWQTNFPKWKDEELYSARYRFVQYLHYLGITLYVEQWFKDDKMSDRKEYLGKYVNMYKNWATAYFSEANKNEKLRKFIEENKDKTVINGIKLPWWKKLSELTVPKERK